MKRHIAMLLTAVAATLLTIASAAAQRNSGATALEAARQKEILSGDPNAAIKNYSAIVKQFEKTDRAAAAMALFRMAEAYARLGDKESRRIYDQVVKTYGDQPEAVNLARERLGVAGQPAGQVNRVVWTRVAATGGRWGRLSPDSLFVSYSDFFSNSSDIFLHEIATGAELNLTNRPKGSMDRALESIISPDGKQIAFVGYGQQDNRYEVRLANLMGDPNPRRLYSLSDGYDLFIYDWSPDGKTLAIAVHRNDRSVQIGLLSVSNASLRVLKTIDWLGNRTIEGMYFSRDGRYLGVDLPQNTSEERDIYVLAIDGSREDPVVQDPSGDDQIVGFSPDGKWILFKSDRSGTVDLYAAGFSDGKSHGRPQRLRANIAASFRPIGWTHSGALYYQTASTPAPDASRLELASLNFNTGAFLATPIPLTRGYLERTSSPLFSADGKSLAYLSGLRDGSGNDEIIIRSTDAGTIRELRPKQVTNLGRIAAWAPDGRSVMVTGRDLQDRTRLFRVDVETGNASSLFPDSVLPSSLSNWFPDIAWMPDGVSFVTNTGPTDGIYRFNSGTGEWSLVVDYTSVKGNQFASAVPALSPDGKTLYYRQGLAAASDAAIFKRDLDTGAETELIRRAHLDQVNLSPDGLYSATVSTDTATNSRLVLLVPTAGGPPRELLRVTSEVRPEELSNERLGQWVRVMSWSKDSRSLLLRKTFDDPNKPDELWLRTLDGQESAKVSAPRLPERRQLSLSSNHQYAAYTLGGGQRPPRTIELSILENFLPTASTGNK